MAVCSQDNGVKSDRGMPEKERRTVRKKELEVNTRACKFELTGRMEAHRETKNERVSQYGRRREDEGSPSISVTFLT